MGLTGIREVRGTPPTDFLSRMVASTLIQQGEQLAVFTDPNGVITFAGGERAPTLSTHPVDAGPPVSSPANVQDLQQQVESLKASHAVFFGEAGGTPIGDKGSACYFAGGIARAIAGTAENQPPAAPPERWQSPKRRTVVLRFQRGE